MMHDPRTAGAVKRYHTWRVIQSQSVAEHSWNVARIVLSIWPDCPKHILAQALFHDLGEVASGDAPYPVKKNNPALKQEIDRIEDEAIDKMIADWMIPKPYEWIKVWQDKDRATANRILKLADMLEMWEFGLVECELGNAHGVLIAEGCYKHCLELAAQCPTPVETRFYTYYKKRVETHSHVMQGRETV